MFFPPHNATQYSRSNFGSYGPIACDFPLEHLATDTPAAVVLVIVRLAHGKGAFDDVACMCPVTSEARC